MINSKLLLNLGNPGEYCNSESQQGSKVVGVGGGGVGKGGIEEVTMSHSEVSKGTTVQNFANHKE